MPESLPWDCDWIVDNQICAMRLPDEADIAQLADLGITLVVSVASESYADAVGVWCRRYGPRWVRYYVRDMTPPELSDIRDFVTQVTAELDAGGKVAVHCLGGIGRTGTLIAAYLVSTGKGHEAAMREVRRRRPGSIQTTAQELVIAAYASEVRSEG